MSMVNIKINGMELSVPAEYTVLEAARENGIEIPTLCYLKDCLLYTSPSPRDS